MEIMIQHAHELLAAGLTPADIRSEVREGRLVRLRRGSYAPPSILTNEPESRHRALIHAVAPRHADAIVSHVSAAVLHGLPVPERTLSRVHLVKPRNGRDRRAARATTSTEPSDRPSQTSSTEFR
ncbi:hypothetical protein [Mariniluteicoccus flavus]